MEFDQNNLYPLIDEEGNTVEFVLIGKTEYKGAVYYAMIPADETEQAEDGGFYEYVILREEPAEDGNADLVSIDDDEEFDNVADLFDDMFSEEIDYDGE